MARRGRGRRLPGVGDLLAAFSLAAPLLAAEGLASGGGPGSGRGLEVRAAWEFREGLSGWSSAGTTALEVRDGLLRFSAASPDPILFGPEVRAETSPLDAVEIRVRSSVAGRWELFWRHDREGPFEGYSQALSAGFDVPRSDAVRTVRLRPFWHGRGPVLSVRIDPPAGEGEFALESVRILGPGSPRAEGFAGPGDAPGGSPGAARAGAPAAAIPSPDAFSVDPPGASISSPEGVEVVFPDREVRFASPPLALDADARKFLAIEASVLDPPAGTVETVLEFAAQDRPGAWRRGFRLRGGARARCVLSLEGDPAWRGTIAAVLIGLRSPGSARIAFRSVEALERGAAFREARGEDARADDARGEEPRGEEALLAPATGFEFQTLRLSDDLRRVVSEPRIDIAKEAPPPARAVASDYTVAMWYFAAWEPEYVQDGWKHVAERAPWRLPLLYDSSDPEMEFSGIRYYRASSPRAIDWHVRWMREHAVNLILWDWYPRASERGEFDPGFFGNRALEVGFLGKTSLGGPPVATNRFEGKIDFAAMWTNHRPFHRVGRGIERYLAEQFFSQPNYYRLDGKPLLILWDPRLLVEEAGSEAGAREVLEGVRAAARERGHPGVWIAGILDPGAAPLARAIGLDGAAGYHYASSGGFSAETRALGEGTVEDRIEDYASQTIPGHARIWSEMARAFGRDYLLATTPMQNWEPTLRPVNFIQRGSSPDAYREMLRRARAFIEARGLRRFVTIEAWNEWLEGSYVEPSAAWGTAWLEAIRDAFAPSLSASRPRAEAGGSPLWTAVWITDTQTPECEGIAALVSHVAASRPKLVLHTGDTRFEWANRCAWREVLELLRIETPPLEFHLAPGNHDLTNGVLKAHLRAAASRGVYLLDTGKVAPGLGYYHDRVTEEASGPAWPVWNPEVAAHPAWQPSASKVPADHRRPDPPYRYAFRRGGIRFIVCDCYPTEELRDWVRATIASDDGSSASILLQHKHEVDEIAPYFEGLEGRHNVRLVLTGDHHRYLLEERGGVTFVTGAGMAQGPEGENDAFTLRVYPDRLELDRHAIPTGQPREAIRTERAIWSCPGRFSAYERPESAASPVPLQPSPAHATSG